jgi:oligopeptide transport system substrate-binding protein
VVDTRASARPDRATRGPTDARPWASPDGRLVAQTLSYAATGRRTDGRGPRRLGPAALLTILVAVCLVAGCSAPAIGAESDRPVRILSGGAATLDPAAAGDAGSANVIGQLYETLTSFDTTLTLRPALAETWDIQDGGRRIVFRLRDGLTFSDGTPLTSDDVVRSWMRVIDPADPSPLVSLMSDVEGAMAYARGQSSDPSSVGLHADGQEVTVDLNRPAADFVTVVASPTFSVVPPGMDDDPDVTAPGSFVSSGGYTLASTDPGTTTLAANPHYWAGEPPIKEVQLVQDIEGRSPIEDYEAGRLDYLPLGDFDASWIAYDRDLGPDLREVPALAVQYYGFDTTRPPFDDVKVRQAFGAAVDWRRIAALGTASPEDVATSMVPPGMPGRSDRDYLPVHDPDKARQLLSEAGFPGGQGFPEVTMLTGGGLFDEALVTELERELGIDIKSETMGNGYFDRLNNDPPQIWSLSWIADYPGPNDFLGVLLGSDASNNYGRWSSPEFDAAIADAGAATDPDDIRAAFDRAEEIVQRDVPVVPVSYGTGWALSRPELLGADQNGLGAVRMAGLAWDD